MDTIHRASDKSNLAGFLGKICGKIGRFRGNFAGIFEANFAEKESVKND